MKAVGYYRSDPANAPVLVDLDAPKPEPGPRDLLIEVRAISVNPIDVKVINAFVPKEGEARILGFDAAGVVVGVGSETSLFSKGDEVFYAGHFDRQGSNAEFQIVDERLVGLKPSSATFPEAAALPLTSITAYELLFDRMLIPKKRDDPENPTERKPELLIIGASGGAGSMVTQLAALLADVGVIATSSTPEGQEWCRNLGAREVIDHYRPLDEALADLRVKEVRYVAGLTATEKHFHEIMKFIAPEGCLGIIDDVTTMDFATLKRKCIRVAWEFMFARGLFRTPDMARQHDILTRISRLVDAGSVRSTMTKNLGPINAENLGKAHKMIARGGNVGKMVLEGF